MPTYTLLGVTFFIPDLNDLANAVVAPLQTFIANTLSGIAGAVNTVIAPLEIFITTARDYIVNAVISAFNYLVNLPATISAFFQTTLLPALQGLFSPVANAIAQIVNAVAGLPSAIGGVGNLVSTALANLAAQVTSQVGSAILSLMPPVVQNLIVSAVNDLKAFLANPLGSLSALGGTIVSSLTAFGSTVTAQLANIQADLGNRVSTLEHSISNVGDYVNSAFNQLSTQLNAVFSGFGNALNGLGVAIWQAFDAAIIKPAQALIGQVGALVTNAVAQVQNTIKTTLINALPRTPQQAFDSALIVAEVGLGALVVGEVSALALEAIYPTKHLGIPHAFEKALDALGLTAIGGALYGVIVDSGWSTQLRYFFNYQLQPQRVDEATAISAVYAGVLTLEGYAEELRYMGFNDVAIAYKTSTIYEPVNVRLLVTLWEDNLVDDAFIVDQLRRQGLSPDNAGTILKALQFRALKPFEATAKGLILTQFKDGLLDSGTATRIMDAFGVPKSQESLVFELGRLQFVYEQKVLGKAYILDLLKKAVISSDEATSSLEALGFDAERAKVLVNIALTTALPTPTKAQRQALLAALTGAS